MRINKLVAENIKRLKAVEITPEGNLVKISGRNRQGKTSLLDCIWWALKGLANVQEKPIREGEDSGQIIIDLGDYVVTRRFTNSGSTLTVENTAGARFQSPQALLDGMVGSLSFDPLEFARERPAEQYAQLAQISGLGDELAKIEAREDAQFALRRDANRDVKRLDSSLTQFDDLPEEDTPVPPDMTELWEVVNQGERKNMDIDSVRSAITYKADQVKKLKAQLRAAEKVLKEEQATLVALGDPVDLTEAKADLERAKGQLSMVGRYEQRDTVAEQLSNAVSAAAKADRAVVKHRKARLKMISDAKFPIKGLGLEAGEVTFNGISFAQASSAEQLRVSMAIAMHGNPDIRIIRVTDASLLDSESLATIEEMADAEDFQIWLEIVDETKKIGVVIEDGQVLKVNK